LPDPAVNSTSRKLALHIQRTTFCQFISQGWPVVGWDRWQGECGERRGNDAEQNRSLKIP